MSQRTAGPARACGSSFRDVPDPRSLTYGPGHGYRAGLELFDSLVVGAGAAGCVAARRLIDAGQRVLLVEAGPTGRPPALTTIDAVAALDEPDWFWPELAVRSAGAAGAVGYRQGRGVGGSTAVNSLVLMIGDRSDYDRWALEWGCPGWDWSSLAPWFDRAVSMLTPTVAEFGPLATAIAPLVEAAGHPLGGASLGADFEGYAPATLAVADSRRRSAADAYLPGPRWDADACSSEGARRLTVRSGSPVGRVLTDGGRAVGVELEGGERLAAGAVVLAAGALGTPRILRRSSVGGPGVGRALQDHPSFTFTIDLRLAARQPTAVPAAPISGLLRWSSPDRPPDRGSDLVALVMDHVGTGAAGRRYGALIVMLADVESRGMIPPDGSMAEPAWLMTGSDRARFRAGVRHVAALLADDALAAAIDGVYVDDRGTPLGRLIAMGDAELDRWLADHPGPVSHPAGTCRLGSDPEAVVTPEGAVVGVDGLAVVDASVLPRLPTANPQLPVMAVAERLSASLLA